MRREAMLLAVPCSTFCNRDSTRSKRQTAENLPSTTRQAKHGQAGPEATTQKIFRLYCWIPYQSHLVSSHSGQSPWWTNYPPSSSSPLVILARPPVHRPS